MVVRAVQRHIMDRSVIVLYQLAHVNSSVLLSLITSNAAWGLLGEGGVLACSSVEMITLCEFYSAYRAI